MERGVKKFILIKIAGKPGTFKELIPQDLLPDPINFVPLGEKSVATNIEQVSLIVHRARQTAHGVVRLEHHRWDFMLRKFKCGGQSGGTCSNNDNKFFLRQGWKHSLLVLGWAFSCNFLTTRLVLSLGKYGCCHLSPVPNFPFSPFHVKLFPLLP